MATERENFSTINGLGALNMRAYDIEGNKIRAFFDATGGLVFVIDDTITPDKPNALLVINSDDGRKWDDILSNDYGVSLEAVRPKKDNKYQKLDIEYVGLDEYDDLIRDYDDGIDVADSLSVLMMYRVDASRRAATERLAAAEDVAQNARETIQRAQDSVADTQARIKTLRTKLSQQKKTIGREPTKQSAAKILRTESQIDALRDKQQRAQRRLDNARRRLVAAEEDAETARGILARVGGNSGENVDMGALPVAASPHSVMRVSNEVNLPVAATAAPAPVVKESFNETSEQKAADMAEDEVKPLFDKDPEILDEEIAFKPIDFDIKPAPTSTPDVAQVPRFDDFSDAIAPAPLSFTPPTNDFGDNNDVVRPAPVLDTITSVEMPMSVAPVQSEYNEPVAEPAPAVRPAPISPTVPGAGAATAGAVRPVSPVTGAPAVPVDGGNAGRKPTLMYYVLLIALIVLSVFTLWLYQQKNSDTVPDLAATAAPEEKVEETPADDVAGPFIQVEEKVTVTEKAEPDPEPIVADVVPTPTVEPEPVAPIVDETVPGIPVVAEPDVAPVMPSDETPFISEPEPEPEPVKAPVVVNKPAYNAGSQNENMFVADTEYDTDVVATNVAAPTPVVDYQETSVIENGAVCDDGTTPSVDGCCGDEVYTNIGGGAYACCSESTGDCYPPMF